MKPNPPTLFTSLFLDRTQKRLLRMDAAAFFLMLGSLVVFVTGCFPKSRSPIRSAQQPQTTSIKTLTRQLQSPSAWKRLIAAERLSKQPVLRQHAISPLVNAICDPNYWVRSVAVRTLRQLGAWSVPELHSRLTDKNKLCRVNAAYLLGSIRPQHPNLVPDLIQMLRASDPREVVTALYSLGRLRLSIKTVLPHLVKSTKHPDIRVQRKAIAAIGTLGFPADMALTALFAGFSNRNIGKIRTLRAFRYMGTRALPQVHKELKADDPKRRSQALQILTTLGYWKRQENLPLLRPYLTDKDENVRQEAWYTLRRTAFSFDAYEKLIQKALKDPSPQVRRECVLALWNSKSKKKFGLLWKMLEDPSKRIRTSALFALSQDYIQKILAKKQLTKMLTHTHWRIQMQAIYSLGWSSQHTARYIKNLKPFAQHAQWPVRHMLAHTLGRAGVHSPEALKLLGTLLKDSQWKVRQEAAQALAHIGPEAGVVLPTIRASLNDKKWEVQRASFRSLRWLATFDPKVIPELITLTQRDEPRIQLAALTVLGKLRIQLEQVIPALIAPMKSKSLLIQQNATRQIRALSKALWKRSHEQRMNFMRIRLAELGMAPLRQALQSKDRALQISAAWALSYLGESAAPAMKELTPWLHHKDRKLRLAATNALGLLETRPEIVIPIVTQLLQSSDVELQRQGAIILGRLGDKGVIALPTLLPLMNQSNPKLRQVALESIVAMKARTPSVISHLLMGLHSPIAEERKRIHQTLEQMKTPPQTDAVFAQALQDPNRQVRRATLRLLGRSGVQAIPSLRQFLRSPANGSSRITAIFVLMRLKEEAAPAVPELRQSLEDRDPRIVRIALEALGAIGPKAAPAVPQMRRLLQSEFDQLRLNATWALGRIGPNAAPAVPELLRVLQEPSIQLKRAASKALGLIGSKAKAALPILRRTRQDPDPKVRQAAKEAIQKIQN